MRVYMTRGEGIKVLEEARGLFDIGRCGVDLGSERFDEAVRNDVSTPSQGEVGGCEENGGRATYRSSL